MRQPLWKRVGLGFVLGGVACMGACGRGVEVERVTVRAGDDPIARSAMEACRARIEIERHNLANVSTPGFKRVAVVQESVPLGMDAEGAMVRRDGRGGVRIGAMYLDLSAGSPVRGDGALDLLIDGAGFFCVEDRDGARVYTRDGRFALNAEREVVMRVGGRALWPRMTAPPDAMSLAVLGDGSVWAYVTGDAEPVAVGQIELAQFTAAEYLLTVEGGVYRACAACGGVRVGTPETETFGSVTSGYFEGSNVDPEQAMLSVERAERELAMWRRAGRSGGSAGETRRVSIDVP